MTIRPTTDFRMTSAEWAVLLALSLVWGGGFFFGQLALAELPPFTIVFCRVTLATVALLVTAAMTRQTIALPIGAWPIFLGLGMLNCLVPFALLLWGQAQMGSGLTSVLAATTPLFTVLVAHFLSPDERLTKARLIGVSLGFAGAAVALSPALPEAADNLLPGASVLAAALCYAFAGVLGRRVSGMPTLTLAVGQLATTSLLSLPIALAIEKPWSLAMPSATAWAALLALALFSTALGYLLFFRLLARAGAVNVSLVSLLVPITSLLLAGLVLGEPLGWREISGMGLILVGLAVLDGRRGRSTAVVDLTRPSALTSVSVESGHKQ